MAKKGFPFSCLAGMKNLRYVKKISICLLFILCFLYASFITPCQEPGVRESPGKLSRVHKELNGVENCAGCHTAKGKIAPAKCLDCHKELARRISTGKGYHKEKGEDCAACHQEHNGENYPLVQWNIEEFDHRETGYLLTGAHRKVTACHSCHTPANSPARKNSKSFFLKDNRCSACHKDAHNGTQPDCTGCHTTKDWSVDIW